MTSPYISDPYAGDEDPRLAKLRSLVAQQGDQRLRALQALVDQQKQVTPDQKATAQAVFGQTDQSSGDQGFFHTPEVTPLPSARVGDFTQWLAHNRVANPDDGNYDYRGAFLAGINRDSTGHFPDTYKQHGHPTFSVESQYSRGPDDGGHWDGATYVPAGPRVIGASGTAQEPPPSTIASVMKQAATGELGGVAKLVPGAIAATARDVARTGSVVADIAQAPLTELSPSFVHRALQRATAEHGGDIPSLPSQQPQGSLWDRAVAPIDALITKGENVVAGKPRDTSEETARGMGEMVGQFLPLAPQALELGGGVINRVMKLAGRRSVVSDLATAPPPEPKPIDSHAEPVPEPEPVPSTPIRGLDEIRKDIAGAMAAAKEADQRGFANLARQYQSQANKYIREAKGLQDKPEEVTPSALPTVDNDAATGLPVGAGPKAPLKPPAVDIGKVAEGDPAEVAKAREQLSAFDDLISGGKRVPSGHDPADVGAYIRGEPSPLDPDLGDQAQIDRLVGKQTAAEMMGKTPDQMEQVLHPSKGLPEGVSSPAQRASVEKITNEAMDQSAVDQLVGEQTAKAETPIRRKNPEPPPGTLDQMGRLYRRPRGQADVDEIAAQYPAAAELGLKEGDVIRYASGPSRTIYQIKSIAKGREGYNVVNPMEPTTYPHDVHYLTLENPEKPIGRGGAGTAYINEVWRDKEGNLRSGPRGDLLEQLSPDQLPARIERKPAFRGKAAPIQKYAPAEQHGQETTLPMQQYRQFSDKPYREARNAFQLAKTPEAREAALGHISKTFGPEWRAAVEREEIRNLGAPRFGTTAAPPTGAQALPAEPKIDKLRQVLEETRQKKEATLAKLQEGHREFQRDNLVKVVTPDASGKLRITTFDKNGPHGHELYNTMEEVASELRNSEPVPHGTLQRLVNTEEFGKGLDWADEIRKGNIPGKEQPGNAMKGVPTPKLDKIARRGADLFTSPKGTSFEETAKSSHERDLWAKQRDRLQPAVREAMLKRMAAELATREPKGDFDDAASIAKLLRKHGYPDAAKRYEDYAASEPKGRPSPVPPESAVGRQGQQIMDRVEGAKPKPKKVKPPEAPAPTAEYAPKIPEGLELNPESRPAEQGETDAPGLYAGAAKQAYAWARRSQDAQERLQRGVTESNRILTQKQKDALLAAHKEAAHLYRSTLDEIEMAFGTKVADALHEEIGAHLNQQPEPPPSGGAAKPAKVKKATVEGGGNPKFKKMSDDDLIARRHQLIQRIDDQNKVLDQNVVQFARERDFGGKVVGTSIKNAGGRAIGQIKTAGRILDELDAEFKHRGIGEERLSDELARYYDQQTQSKASTDAEDLRQTERNVESAEERKGIEEEQPQQKPNPPGFTAFSHGGVGGAVVGGAVGAKTDKEHPARGLIVGALLGGAVGTAAMHGVKPRVPAGQALPAGIRDDILRLLAPGAREGGGIESGNIIRHRSGELAFHDERAVEKLKQFRRQVSRLSVAESRQFIDDIENGRPTASKLQPVANVLRDLLDEAREEVRGLGTGALENFYENYFPHIWKEPPAQVQKILGKRPLEGPRSFLKQRTIQTFDEGVKAGLHPVTENPLDLVLLKHREMRRYIMGQRILQDFKRDGLAKFVRATERAPDGYRRLDDHVATVYGPGPKESITVRGHYWAPEPVERVFRNYLSPGLRGRPAFDKWMYAGNLMNQVQLGISAFHLGFTSIDAATSKMALAIEQLASGHPIKAAGSVLGVPTAPLTTIWKGAQLRHAYLAGDMSNPLVRSLIEAGGRISQPSLFKNNALESFLDAVKERRPVAAGFHGVSTILETLSKPILDGIVPRQKLGVFADLAQFELDRLPANATEAQRLDVMRKVWDSVDNRMGQMVYDNLFWHRTLKDLAMASTRSVGWNLGTIRELGGGALDMGTGTMSHRAAYAIALPITVGLMGAVTTYLYTGHGPRSLKDYYLPPTGQKNEDGNEERVQLPSYVKDVIAYGRHPLETIGHKTQPLLSTVISMLENKDYYGDKIRNENDPLVQQVKQEAEYLAKQFVPFGIRNAMQERQYGQTRSTGALSFVGITPAPRELVRSPAQQKMAEILGDRGFPSRTPEQVESSDRRRTILDAFKSGELTKRQVADSARVGVLTHRQALDIQRRGQQPAIVGRFKHLSRAEAEEVYARANAEERKQWWPILWKKRLGAMAELRRAGAATPDYRELVGLMHRDKLHGPPPVAAGAAP